MEDQKKLYEMTLHESFVLKDKGISVMRVPGGWIYSWTDGPGDVFIPFNNEFQVLTKTETKFKK